MLPAWTAGYTHLPRRSHEQAPSEIKHSRSSTSASDEQREPRRRTSSDSTPRQAAASTRFVSEANEEDANRSVLSTTSTDVFTSSRRLGYFADKISSSLSGGSSGANIRGPGPPSQHLHPHSHTKTDSSSATSPSISPTPSMNPSASTVNLPKSHPSPSKGSYGRTYDPKQMHRLAPQLSSGSSISLAPPGSISQVSFASNNSADPWGALHVHVLPLFNGEPLKIPVEDLNTLVKRHIQTVVTSTPNRALSKLETDAEELISAGMVTLNANLKGIKDDKLIARVVETWNFFWGQVLTYLEGVLLPLQTHPLLSSLYRTPKPHRAKSPNRQNNIKSSSEHASIRIDVRTTALRSFRDRVIFSLAIRLLERIRQDSFTDTYQPRLQQMLLVLASQSESRSTATFSLSPPDPDAYPSAAAIDDLLRALRNIRQPERPGMFRNNAQFPVRAPSFLSGGLPRDRRGRVAHKHRSKPSALILTLSDDDDVFGDETPRMGPCDAEHRRRAELLNSLRSPDLEPPPDPRASGGWGLGAGQVDKLEEDEDEELDHFQIQERSIMDNRGVAMGSPTPERRRRLT